MCVFFIRSLGGSKVSKKNEKQTKQTKQTQDVESQYEERQERIAAKVDENAEAMSVDPVDALPVKSLTGELSYRSTANQVSGRFLELCYFFVDHAIEA